MANGKKNKGGSKIGLDSWTSQDEWKISDLWGGDDKEEDKPKKKPKKQKGTEGYLTQSLKRRGPPKRGS